MSKLLYLMVLVPFIGFAGWKPPQEPQLFGTSAQAAKPAWSNAIQDDGSVAADAAVAATLYKQAIKNSQNNFSRNNLSSTNQAAGLNFPNRTFGLARSQKDPLVAAMEEFKNATTGETKTVAEDKIVDILEKQYDDFLEENEKQIEQLQQRLDQLKNQLDKRRRAKSKMVDLEKVRIINESEGLIWPDRQKSRKNSFFRRGLTSSPGSVNLPRLPSTPGPAATPTPGPGPGDVPPRPTR
ncbi:MAG: hypothetical protein AAGA30_03365 [Planctomycetota bacterium]